MVETFKGGLSLDKEKRDKLLRKLAKIGTYAASAIGLLGAFIAGFMFLGAAGLFTWFAGLDFIPLVVDDILAAIGSIFSFIGAVIIAIPSGILLVGAKILRDRLIDKFYSYTEDYGDRYDQEDDRFDSSYSYYYDDDNDDSSYEQRSSYSSYNQRSTNSSSNQGSTDAFSDPIAKMRENYKHCKNRTQLENTHKNLQKIFHPDNGGSHEDFLAVEAVYEELLSKFPE